MFRCYAWGPKVLVVGGPWLGEVEAGGLDGETRCVPWALDIRLSPHLVENPGHCPLKWVSPETTSTPGRR